jgi:hypothetical protein
MLTQQIIRDVGPDGNVCFNLPDFIGKKVRIIFSTITDAYTGNKMEMDDDQEFNAAAYWLSLKMMRQRTPSGRNILNEV